MACHQYFTIDDQCHHVITFLICLDLVYYDQITLKTTGNHLYVVLTNNKQMLACKYANLKWGK